MAGGGNWMGWNFGHSGTQGSGHGELDYVVVDVFVTGEGPIEGTFVADIVVSAKDGKTALRSEHLDAATLQAARERAEGLAAAANGPAGNAYRSKVWTDRDRWSSPGHGHGGASPEGFDPSGMGGE